MKRSEYRKFPLHFVVLSNIEGMLPAYDAAFGGFCDAREYRDRKNAEKLSVYGKPITYTLYDSSRKQLIRE